jgi:hypothetical protein
MKYREKKKNVGAILAVLVVRRKARTTNLCRKRNWGSGTIKSRNHGILHVATMWINVSNSY